MTMAGSRHRASRPSVVGELEAAQSRLWDADRRRYAADDAAWQLIKGGRHSEPEYLTTQLELAHAHMVGRDIAERAVMAAFEAPRPARADAEHARDLLRRVLNQYTWHSSALDSTVRYVRDQCERLGDGGRMGRRRRVGSRLTASVPLAVAPTHVQVSRTPAAHR